MSHKPILTIGMPVFNPDRYFRSAIVSLANQSFQDWELIIIDDGSQTDVYKFIKDLIDPRFIILQDGVNKGLASRLNECIRMARGLYFARMDADDISYPERFEKQITYLNKFENIDLLATRALVIGEDHNPKWVIPHHKSHEELVSNPWRGIYMPHPTWMGRLSWFKKYMYAEPAPYLCEDQELLLRAHRESRYETLNEILLAYRVRDWVDKKKLLKTRRAILNFQLRFFWGKKSYLHCVLSMLAYSIKRFRDLSRLLIPIKNNLKSQSPSAVDLAQWQSICSQICIKT